MNPLLLLSDPAPGLDLCGRPDFLNARANERVRLLRLVDTGARMAVPMSSASCSENWRWSMNHAHRAGLNLIAPAVGPGKAGRLFSGPVLVW